MWGDRIILIWDMVKEYIQCRYQQWLETFPVNQLEERKKEREKKNKKAKNSPPLSIAYLCALLLSFTSNVCVSSDCRTVGLDLALQVC